MIRSRRLALLILIMVCASVVLCWWCGILRAPRPPFANRYGIHPEFRPPWSRWWVDPPLNDRSGTTIRCDHSWNVMVVHISANTSLTLYSSYPDNRVLDDNGKLLLWNDEHQLIEPAPASPNLLSTRNRLIFVTGRTQFNEFEIPPRFSEQFERRQREAIESSNYLDQLISISQTEKMDKLYHWLTSRNESP